MYNNRDLIGKSGEYLTKMFLFSIFNLIKKDYGVSEEKIYRYTTSRTCNIKVTKINVVQIFTATVLAQLV